MPSLPKYVVLKSKYNGKYLQHNDEEGPLHVFLQFIGEDVANKYAKFQVELAQSNERLVNIRCCYNNKYWGRSDIGNHWIRADTDKPEEDTTKASCTLFQPSVADADHGIRFKHVNSGCYAVLIWDPGSLDDECLAVRWDTTDNDMCDVYTVVDWESLVILPKYVVFKGDIGKYLRGTSDGNLHFGASEITGPNLTYEVFTNPDGSMRFKSISLGKFWRLSPNWIWVDSDDTSNDNKDTLFWPVQIEDNVIAISSMGNDRFCVRFSNSWRTNSLNADSPNIVQEARLEVEEPVINRSIYNIQYHLMRARIYNEQEALLGNGIAANTTDDTSILDINVPCTETKSSSWSDSVSLKLGVKTSLTARTPFIFQGKIKISAEVESAYHMPLPDLTPSATQQKMFLITK